MSHTRVRLAPEARREQLLDLGVGLLATRTLDELSIDLLAEKAEISRGLLYHYFRNKQEFHRAVVRRAAAEVIAITDTPEDLEPWERLGTGLAAYVDYVQANYQAFVSLVRDAAHRDPELREIYLETRRVLTDRIFGSLHQLDIADSPAVRLMAGGWAALVEETVLAWAEHPTVPRQRLLEMLTAALPGVLHGAGEPR